ncbi:MAG TPA: hypothetical protein QF564_01370 [Pirellulaceae bacterium]|jgi:hypothetical protein|nr:hypothetical protein [Pirellulaceae bacterium]
MNDEEPYIKDRLADVLNSILCPVAGCWPLHGGHSEYYFDTDAESHVLEVWPVGIEEPEEHEGNGHHQAGQGLLYELAEFDFIELAKSIALEHFHFSQRRSIFEIGWEENGQQLELRVHLVPVEVAEEI